LSGMPPRIGDRHLSALRSLAAALEELGIDGALIGGVAVSLLAEPRFTRDLDAVIMYDTEVTASLMEALAHHDLIPLFDDAEQFARESRVIPLRHKLTGIVVDVMLGCMPFESEVVARAKPSGEPGVPMSLATPEDLVILKAIASRPKDLEDIRNIALTYPDMDRARIEHWVREYGELLETPDLWERTRGLLDG
jgi:hypothetical protein